MQKSHCQNLSYLSLFQSVHDHPHPSENYLKLEQMASKVIVPLLGAKILYQYDNTACQEKVDNVSLKSTNESVSSTESFTRKLSRPLSMVESGPSEKDSDFDDLIQYRQQQRFRHSIGGRLSAVDEGQQSLASSFGSLIDD